MELDAQLRPRSVRAPRSSDGTDVTLDSRDFERAAAAAASACAGCRRAALWSLPCLETLVAVAGAWRAGMTLVPLNPASGPAELAHVLRESRPEALLAPEGADVAPALGGLRRIGVRADGSGKSDAVHPAGDDPAYIIFTSGTTGPPKGAVLPFGAVCANLAGLAAIWRWSDEDVLVHALPLFHVHGLVLGTVGPMRAQGSLVHLGRFDVDRVAAALLAGGTMLFGVPTMYHRLARAAETDGRLRDALRGARLLVSGSAALAPADAARIQALTGRTVVERYGLTETLIVCADDPAEPEAGSVGRPVAGVAVRLVDEAGVPFDEAGRPGEVEVRGSSLFSGYLHDREGTAPPLRDGWFRTGDTAVRTPGGRIRILGRTSVDIIKTGGYKVGAAEIEHVLGSHPDVAEVAVTGEPDEDLGERIVAWVVPASGARADADALGQHVAAQLAPHKRPRVVRFVASLPRTPLGKVEKRRLAPPGKA